MKTPGCVRVCLFSLLLSMGQTVLAQKVSLSRTSVDFGTHTVGKTSSPALDVVLTNSDPSIPLTLGSIVASGDYAESDDCNGSVAPASSCELLLTFTANVAGTVKGLLTINDDAPNSPQLVTLTGTGVVPLTVTPASLTFATTAVGSKSPGQTVTVANSLGKGVNFSFTPSGDYAATGSGTTPCGSTLAAAASCTISVKFAPTQSGAINGALEITQNVTATPQVVSFSGTGSGGTAPSLSFNPGTVSFGSIGVGTTSTKTVGVTNNSSQTVNISAIKASGDYSVTGGSVTPCGGALTAGNQCTIAVTFIPTADESFNGAITLTSNGAVKTQILSISGKGVVPLKVSPTSLTFTTQQNGSTSAAQVVTLTNHMKSAVDFNGITVSGDYSVNNSCPNALAPSATCTIAVSFSPIARTGKVHGTLTITSSAPSSPQVVQLSGESTGFLTRFAYVTNENSNTVSEYTADLHTGQLRSNGYVLTGTSPLGLVVAPSNKFAYVVNSGDNTVSAFSINASNGQLKPAGSPVPTGQFPTSLTVTASGSFVYVTNNEGSVSAYTVNSKTGALTAVSGSPYPTGSTPLGIAVTPSGKFAYVTNAGDFTVSAYKIDVSTGALSAIKNSPFPTGKLPIGVATDPSGKFLYIANDGDSTVSAYRSDSSTGALTPISTTPTGGGAWGISVDHSGKFVFVADSDSGGVSAYSINSATGALTPISGSPFASPGTGPTAVVVDTTNQFLYLTDTGNNDVSTFAINPVSGALSFLKTVSTAYGPFSIAVAGGTTPVIYLPTFAYTATLFNDDVFGFTINSTTGDLVPNPSSPFAADKTTDAVAVDPWQRFVYAANTDSSDISAYTIDPVSGSLTQVAGSPFASPLVFCITSEPSGRFVYVCGSINAYAFAISPASGALMQIPGSPYPTNSGASSMSADPSGRFLYVGEWMCTAENCTLQNRAYQIFGFAINPATGALTVIPGSPFATVGSVVTVEASGQFVYAAGPGGISAFSIDSANGALTQISGSPFAAGMYPESFAADPAGEFLYLADANSSVYAYSIDSSSGALTQTSGSPYPAGSDSLSVAVDLSGRFVYVAGTQEDADIDADPIFGYAIDPSTGALTPLPNSPFPANYQPWALTTTGVIH